MKIHTQNLIILIIAILAFAIPAAFSIHHPLNPQYLFFADSRNLGFLTNALNVLTNLPFFFVGVWGIYELALLKKKNLLQIFLILSIFFTGFGSTYFHLNPSIETLIWDRLPMAVGFLMFLELVFIDYKKLVLLNSTTIILAALGILTVLYWGYTESTGRGNQIPYYIVQYGSLFTLVLLLLYNKPNRTRIEYGLILGFYILAKITESKDYEIYRLGEIISGHSIKHLLAGFSCFLIVRKALRNSFQ